MVGRTPPLPLDDDAKAYGQEALDGYAVELLDEARRIASRAESGSVSKAYVRQAALNLRLRRAGGAVPDLLVSIGMAALAGALGVLATIRTASVDTDAWVEPTTIALVVLGAAAFAVGATLRLFDRRR